MCIILYMKKLNLKKTKQLAPNHTNKRLRQNSVLWLNSNCVLSITTYQDLHLKTLGYKGLWTYYKNVSTGICWRFQQTCIKMPSNIGRMIIGLPHSRVSFQESPGKIHSILSCRVTTTSLTEGNCSDSKFLIYRIFP